MFGLFLSSNPDRRAVVLLYNFLCALARARGIRDEHQKRVRGGSVVAVRNIQAVFQYVGGIRVGKGSLFKFPRVFVQNRLNLRVVCYRHAAAPASSGASAVSVRVHGRLFRFFVHRFLRVRRPFRFAGYGFLRVLRVSASGGCPAGRQKAQERQEYRRQLYPFHGIPPLVAF